MMVESEAYELSEDQMLGAVTFGHQQMQPVIDAIVEAGRGRGEGALRVRARRQFGAEGPRARADRERRCARPSRSDKQERQAAIGAAATGR